jgi:acetyl-CoA synthetase
MNDIDVLLTENRKFPPSEEFRKSARVSSPELYAEGSRDPVAFWERMAGELQGIRKWDKALDWKPPHAQWFVGGKLNVSANCLDRHLNGPRREARAIIWEGEPGDERTLTYAELHAEVVRMGSALRSLGVTKGDRVAIYLPMIPEAAIAMLACARIGAIHSVVFGGFSPESLRDRINDAECKALITADGSYRRGQVIQLKRNADIALEDTPSIEKVIVVQRWRVGEGPKGADIEAPMKEGRDIWYHDLVAEASNECEPEVMDAEDVLFILYTSGTTGKPKGIVHTTGGYLTCAAATTKLVFDLRDDDIFWCTADIGWVTGH